jgi:hypothetical protein
LFGRRTERAVLDSVTPGRLDERVRDRIVAETRGNQRKVFSKLGISSRRQLRHHLALA